MAQENVQLGKGPWLHSLHLLLESHRKHSPCFIRNKKPGCKNRTHFQISRLGWERNLRRNVLFTANSFQLHHFLFSVPRVGGLPCGETTPRFFLSRGHSNASSDSLSLHCFTHLLLLFIYVMFLFYFTDLCLHLHPLSSAPVCLKLHQTQTLLYWWSSLTFRWGLDR